ncbi:MAG: helix-turn-helix domain-containing protein [Chitinophagales bacterium]
MTQKFQIKNMVCPRCIEAVEDIFTQLDYEIVQLVLGEITLEKNRLLSQVDIEQISTALELRGFVLLQDKDAQIVNQIKSLVIEWIHHEKKQPNVKNSVFLSEKLQLSYSVLSKLFSRQEGTTLEKYIIAQRIERVKELLSYKEKTLNQISFDLGYSSVQHLSKQFKTVVGMSVTKYKKQQLQNRKMLTEL